MSHFSNRFHWAGELFDGHFTQFVHRVHAHSHIFEHRVRGHVVRGDGRSVLVPGPIVIRITIGPGTRTDLPSPRTTWPRTRCSNIWECAWTRWTNWVKWPSKSSPAQWNRLEK